MYPLLLLLAYVGYDEHIRWHIAYLKEIFYLSIKRITSKKTVESQTEKIKTCNRLLNHDRQRAIIFFPSKGWDFTPFIFHQEFCVIEHQTLRFFVIRHPFWGGEVMTSIFLLRDSSFSSQKSSRHLVFFIVHLCAGFQFSPCLGLRLMLPDLGGERGCVQRLSTANIHIYIRYSVILTDL